jgi:hypothetical protein
MSCAVNASVIADLISYSSLGRALDSLINTVQA